MRRTRGDVEPCCLRSMSCGRTTQPRLANTTVPACKLLCNTTQAAYDLKPKKKEDEEKNMRKDWKEVTCLLSVLPDTKTWCLAPFLLVDYLLTFVALPTRCQLRCMNLAFGPSCWGVVKITPVRFAHWKLYEGLPFGLSLERLIGNS